MRGSAESGTLNSNGTMLITGPVQIDGRTLNNAGMAIWSAGDIQPFQFTTPDTINNLAGATFEIQGDHNIFQFNAGATLSFNNAGVLRKDTTGGTTQFTSASLFNSGTVDVQTGTLALAGGNSSGTFNIASGAALSFTNYTFNPGTDFTGGGSVSFSGEGSFNTNITLANLALTGTFSAIGGTGRVTIAHEFDLQRGDLFGPGTLQINSGATMNVTSPPVRVASTVPQHRQSPARSTGAASRASKPDRARSSTTAARGISPPTNHSIAPPPATCLHDDQQQRHDQQNRRHGIDAH